MIVLIKQELKNGLIDYFEVKGRDSTTYSINITNDRKDDCFDVSDFDEINEQYVDDIVEYIFKYHSEK